LFGAVWVNVLRTLIIATWHEPALNFKPPLAKLSALTFSTFIYPGRTYIRENPDAAGAQTFS